jgi:hypothetical protein
MPETQRKFASATRTAAVSKTSRSGFSKRFGWGKFDGPATSACSGWVVSPSSFRLKKLLCRLPSAQPERLVMYRNLDPAKIVETARTLNRRIIERFPDAGLGRLSGELLSVTEEAADVSGWLAKPHLPLRILAWLGIALLASILMAGLIVAFSKMSASPAFSSLADLLQGLDAAINEVVLTGVAVFFLFNLETRLKRARALKVIHVLRSMAHIIDMHQLTKDPERLSNPVGAVDTASSPKRQLTPFELTRYLDYCSESLSVISKVGALYVQHFNDPVTLSAVNDVEELTTGLSRKIWQKIMILDRIIAPAAGR